MAAIPYTGSAGSQWYDTMSERWKEAPEALKQVLSHTPHINVNVFQGKLSGKEMFWVTHQPFLLSRGYTLRPRYNPDWVPSWKDKPLESSSAFYNAEDALWLARGDLLDGIRVSDGSKVVIKRVETWRQEIPIAQYLSSPELATDPQNRTVPILDIFPVPDDDSKVRVGEFAEVVKQYLEGLEFMHKHRIAHRDACWFNLMMDASKMIPRGFHFIHSDTHDGVNLGLEWRDRWSVRPVQYYFIDFGLSQYYSTDEPYETITGLNGQDRSVPELLLPYPYDPFKVDVYQLGNVLLEIVDKYDGLEAFQPLVKAMTSADPNDRPSPSGALKIIRPLSEWALRRRVWPKKYSTRERYRIQLFGAKPFFPGRNC